MNSKILGFICALTLVFTSAGAHNPLTAKFELNSTPGEGAVLSVYLSQAGLHQALLAKFQDREFSTIEVNEYKKLAFQLIKSGTELIVDGRHINILDGGIRLGDHQTDLLLFIEEFPEQARQLEVNITCFKALDGHHTVFWWNDGEAKRKEILSASNKFNASFMDSRETVHSGIMNIGSAGWWLGGAVLAIMLIYIVFVPHRHGAVNP